jgi:hypothetical protein
MEAELIYVVAYACPHCNAALEVRQGDWPGWLRCPICTRPSLPPEPSASTAGHRVEVVADEPQGPLFPSLENGEKELEFRLEQVAKAKKFSTPRLIFSTGFVLSLMLVFAYSYEGDAVRMSIFGVLAVVSLLVVVRLRSAS